MSPRKRRYPPRVRPHRTRPALSAAPVALALLAACSSPDPLTGAAAARSRGIAEPVAVPGEGSGASTLPPRSQDPLFDDARVLAKVNGRVIAQRQVRHSFGASWDQYLSDPETLRRQVDRRVIEMVRERLVIEEGTRLGITLDEDEWERLLRDQEKRAAEQNTTIDREVRLLGMTRREWEEQLRDRRLHLIAATVFTGGTYMRRTREPYRPAVDTFVAPGEVLAWGERHPEEVRLPGSVTVRVIDLRADRFRDEGARSDGEAWAAARDAADAALARIRAGEEFSDLAREVSHGREAADGGLIEPLVEGRRDRVAAVVDWAFAGDRAPGDVSPPLRGPAGYFVLRCDGREEARTAPIEEWGPRVRSRLEGFKAEIAFRDVQIGLVEAATIEPPSVRRAILESLREERRDLADRLK